MLVDDDPVINMIHSKLISKSCSYDVDAHENGKEALHKLAAQLDSDPPELPSLILLDINMPVIDGWQFLAELNKLDLDRSARIKVIIVSSSVDIEDIEKSKTYPLVTDFISKPLTMDRMKGIIAQVDDTMNAE